MDTNQVDIVVPWSTNNKKKAPFKRVRVVGKSTAYLTTNNNKRIKIKEPVEGGVRFTSKYINTVDQF